MNKDALNDDDLLRYSRQILLPEMGIEKQQQLLNSRVLIIGIGGLGSPVALYLAAAGVGHLCLVDGDHVELSNLQRQIIHQTSNIGQSKVSSAASHLANINPGTQVKTIDQALDSDQLDNEIQKATLVIDCSDNFSTRFLLNRLCHKNTTPLVSGAAIRWEGQVSVFRYLDGDACYQCLYGDSDGEDKAETCSNNGVISPLVGIIGSMQALEAIKVLCDVGESLSGRLLVFDALQQQWRTLSLSVDPECSVCQR